MVRRESKRGGENHVLVAPHERLELGWIDHRNGLGCGLAMPSTGITHGGAPKLQEDYGPRATGVETDARKEAGTLRAEAERRKFRHDSALECASSPGLQPLSKRKQDFGELSRAAPPLQNRLVFPGERSTTRPCPSGRGHGLRARAGGIGIHASTTPLRETVRQPEPFEIVLVDLRPSA